MEKKHKALYVFVALTIVMALFVAFMAMPSLSGKEAILPLRPVDPFDPLRGQYMTLSYSINRPEEVGLHNLTQGEAVYVLIEANSTGISNPILGSVTPVAAEPNQLLLKGRYENGMIYYGIEAFFMERGSRLNTTLTGAMAKIKVLSDGRASVIELQKEGKKIELLPREGPFLAR